MGKSHSRVPMIISHTVTSDEATANLAEIEVYSGPLPTDPFKFIGQILRAGIQATSFNLSYDIATGLLTVANTGSASLAENDEIVIIGFWEKV